MMGYSSFEDLEVPGENHRVYPDLIFLNIVPLPAL